MQIERIAVGLAVLGLCGALAGCASVGSSPSAQTGSCRPSAEAHKNTVLSFYREGLIGRKPRNAFERYTSPNFVEHKPDIVGGTREATIAYLEQLIKNVPDPRWEILRTASEGDLVFLHASFTPAAGAPAYAVVDVFRLDDCLIVEHWDVVGAPREQQPNPHSRFQQKIKVVSVNYFEDYAIQTQIRQKTIDADPLFTRYFRNGLPMLCSVN